MMVHENYLDFSYAPVVHDMWSHRGLDRLPGSMRSRSPRPPSATLDASRGAAGRLGGRGHRAGPLQALHPARRSGTFASPAMHIQRCEIDDRDRTVRRTSAPMPMTPQTA